MKKNILLLAAIAAIAAFNIPAIAATGGTYGTCSWQLTDDGVFTLKPTNGDKGELAEWKEYSYLDLPWYGLTSTVKSVVVEGTVVAKTCNSLFMNFSKCTSMDLSGLDVSNVTDFYGMFSGDSALVSLDLSTFNTANATNMGNMFMRCVSLKEVTFSDNFSTSNVATFYGMFSRCYSIERLDLSAFDTSNGICFKGMFNMFGGESKLKYLSLRGWDMSKNDAKETDVNWFFYNCNAIDTLITPEKLKGDSKYIPTLGKDMYDLDNNDALVEANTSIPAGSHTLAAGTDGIKTIHLDDNATIDDNAWYTITGAKLSEKPTTHGIYINKGNKVVIE